MDTYRSRYCLYDAARQAIKDAATGAATGAAGRHQETCATPRQRHDLLVTETRRRSGGNTSVKRQRQEGKSPAGIALTTEAHEGAGDEADAVDGEEGHAFNQEDECLVLLAEAFADDLDLLRKDEHFGGSAKNVAAMADMMRCIASGMDTTEQRMFLDNATR